MFGFKDIYDFATRTDPRQAEQMIETLAQDEQLLDNMLSMLERVQALQGGPQYMSQGGIYHYQPPPQGYFGGRHNWPQKKCWSCCLIVTLTF